jgi:hypothetical protein
LAAAFQPNSLLLIFLLYPRYRYLLVFINENASVPLPDLCFYLKSLPHLFLLRFSLLTFR